MKSNTPIEVPEDPDVFYDDEECDEVDSAVGCSVTNSGEDYSKDNDDMSINSITPTLKRSKAMIVLVLLVGLGGGIAFIIFGLRNEQAVVDDRFETRASQLVNSIDSTVQEYEVAARSVHNVCRRRATTRLQFRQFYEYLTSGGLQFQAAQCVPNVTHDQRAEYEESARLYYTEYYPINTTGVNYTGFKGWEYDPATGEHPLRQHRSDAPFYFPVDRSEPVISNAGALGLDTYSHPFQKREIEMALQSHKPVLGGRLKLVQETEENAYTVIMRHPGIPLSEQEQYTYGTEYPEEDSPNSTSIPRELGVVLIRIPSLLRRRGKEQKESIACYLYDITPANTDGVETYLGAAEYEARVSNESTIVTQVRIPPNDIEYEDLLQRNSNNKHILQVEITIANARWKMVVTPVPGDDAFCYKAATKQVWVVGVLIFLLTIGVAIFLWRNMTQIKMIHKAKSQAEAERRIIASLYPKNVVDRLLEEQRSKQQAMRESKKTKDKWENSPLDSFGKRGSIDSSTKLFGINEINESAPSGTASDSIFGSQPIAQHYPETTILFMDMVGFTQWSRSREPAQVFNLLENTYHAFDMIAKRRRVFKVETVGDCYVAVVGVPNPRKHHAAVMAKFASDCFIKMKALMLELAPALGDDTRDLSLRIGLNSGSVTGGVLRGEKGRFQLFGDSMNTAARMESNGKPGKIHVSPSTAECLIEAGRGKWLTEREDRIVAKGIGEMKTYWVKVSAESRGTEATSSHASMAFSVGDSDSGSEDDEHQKSQTMTFNASDSFDALSPDDEEVEHQKRSQPSRALSQFGQRMNLENELEV